MYIDLTLFRKKKILLNAFASIMSYLDQLFQPFDTEKTNFLFPVICIFGINSKAILRCDMTV